jgi:hypothetical protein
MRSSGRIVLPALGLLTLALLLLRSERPSPGPRPKPAAVVSAAEPEPPPPPPRWARERPDPRTPKPKPAKNPLEGLARGIAAAPSGGGAPYVMREQDASVFFSKKGLTFALLGRRPGAGRGEKTGYALAWGLVGASEVEPRAEGETATRVHRLVGDRSTWTKDQPTWSSVVYDEVRPGVDLSVESRPKSVKYTLQAERASDLAGQRFRYEGAHEIRIAPDGASLEAVMEIGTLVESGLVCYQDGPGGRRDVPARYVAEGPQEYRIELGAHDPAAPLTVDPVIAWSTYLGGAVSPLAEDYAQGIAANGSGDMYVVGYTYCTDLPGTTGQFQPTLQVYFDAFLMKIRGTGPVIEWATYLGGSSYDYGHGVVLDSAGDPHVLGYTASPDFPTTPGAYDEILSGYDTFVMKFTAGGALVWSTLLGGSSSDYGRGIAIDPTGVYVGGYTYSDNFPIVGGFNGTLGATPDGFVAKLKLAGDDLIYSSYLGGNSQDFIDGVAVDSSGALYVAGYTYSTDFPASGAMDTTLGGSVDAFLTKIKPAGTSFEWSTYVGGSSVDYGTAVAVLSGGDPVIVGYTSSSSGFPLVAGSWDTTYNGQEGFAVRYPAGGGPAVYGTFLGGTNLDYVTGAAPGSLNTLFLCGYTYSTNFPVTAGAFRTTSVSTPDGFVTHLNAAGTGLLASTYLGGSQADYAKGIAVPPGGLGVFVTGHTYSADFPVSSPPPAVTLFADPSLGGTIDGFAVALSSTLTSVSYGSFIGGEESRGDDWAYAVAVDPRFSTPDQEIIVAGHTTSSDFIMLPLGAYDPLLSGNQDVFVARIRLNGGVASVVWWTYLGGSSSEQAFGAAVDRLGFPYVVGNTQSTDFPTLTPYDGTIGGTEGFITCLDPDGASLFYSSFLGGTNSDYARAVAVDSSFNAVIVGYTYSSNFPTLNPLFPAVSTTPDVFVTLLDVVGDGVWSTYLGGNGGDFGLGAAIDDAQTVYMTGNTLSTNFPLAGPLSAYGGNTDAFVTRISTVGLLPSLTWSRYLGGSDSDYGTAIVADAAGTFVYATGYTYSNDFPTAPVAPLDGTLNSTTDAYVARLNPADGQPLWSTYLGGNSVDYALALAADASGNVYLTGYTYSSDFPLKGAFDSTINGNADVFVTKIYSSGAALGWSSFIGGAGDDVGRGIAVEPGTGAVYVTGETTSADFPLVNPLDGLLGGAQDAFVVRIDPAGPDDPDFSAPGAGAFRVDTGAAIAVGGWSNETEVVLRAKLTDSDDDSVQLQIEIRPIGTPFSDLATASSALFPSGTLVSLNVPLTGFATPVEFHAQARAVDSTGRSSPWQSIGMNNDSPLPADRDLGRDVLAPSVFITSPTGTGTYYTQSASVGLGGMSSDLPAGVSLVRWTRLNGGLTGSAGGTTSWNIPSIPLDNGLNDIQVEAVDAAGNVGSAVIAVYKDNAAPNPLVINPPPSTVIGTNSITLTGSCTDDFFVQTIPWTNSLGGFGNATLTTVSGPVPPPHSVTWNALITGMSPGFNTISFTARDGANNQTLQQITIHYDNQPPSVTIGTPPSGTVTTSGTLLGTPALAGTAGDNDQVQSVVWENLSDPAPINASGPASGTNSWSVGSGVIPLFPGANTIQVTATDRVGLSSTSFVVVSRDVAPPTVSISTPTDQATFTTGSATVVLGGTAADDVGLSTVPSSISWQREHPPGTLVATGTGTLSSPGTPSSAWSTSPIALDIGDNLFKVTSLDRAGQVSSQALITITYSASAPALTITSPASTPFVTNLASFPISGTTSDDVSVLSMSYTIGMTTTPMSVPGLPSGPGLSVPWTVNVPLSPGTNVVTINSSDASTTTSVALTLILDVSPPLVSITGPTSADDHYTGLSAIPLSGTTSDNRSVTSVAWQTDGAGIMPNSGFATIVGGTWSVPSIGLALGSQTITVTATDEAGTTSTDTLVVTRDDTVPTVLITSPTVADTHVTASTPLLTLGGSATDDTLLGSISWVNAANGTGGAATLSGGAGWTVASVTLAAGANPISVVAIDRAGNVATDTIIVYYDPPTDPPVVTITGPSSPPSFTTNSATIVLSGTASDLVGIDRVEWLNGTTGAGGIAAGTTSWFEPSVSLNPGPNLVTVTAFDLVGNSSSEQITIHHDPTLPTVTITPPAGGNSTTGTPFDLAGTAFDVDGGGAPVDVVQVRWMNLTTGGLGSAALTPLVIGPPFVPGAWAASIPLTSGNNDIEITAEDAAGNTTTATITITYDPAAPIITIITPTTDLSYTTPLSPTVLAGTASDDVGLLQVTWSTTAAVSPTTGTAMGTDNWSISDLPLAPGPNVITITAEDTVGRTGTARITLIYDPDAPTIVITVPTAEPTYMTTTSPLALAGSASDNIDVQTVTWANATTGDSGAALGTGAWAIGSIPLIEGMNTITVTATDTVGNTGEATVVVTYDGTLPSILITSPALDPFPTTTRPLLLAGTAGDNLNLASVTWTNSAGGGGSADTLVPVTPPTDYAWTASVYLFPGANLITVTATDAHGYTQVDTVTINFTPETGAPGIQITAPSATGSAISPGQIVTLSGDADDLVGVVDVSWINQTTRVRGTALMTPPAGGTVVSWDADVPLTAGANVIVVTARDDAGNTTTATITVTYNPSSDAIPPAVTIALPTLLDLWDSTVSPIGLGITASDNAGTSGVASVTWFNAATGGDGVATYVLGTTWTASVGLAAGANTITVTAYDPAGNTATDFIIVNFIPPPGDSANPVVTITSHPTGTTLAWAASTIPLGGTASDNVAIATVVWLNALTGMSGSADGTDVWTAAILLGPGINVLTVRTYDTSGNTDTDQITVTYTPPPPPPEFVPAGHCGLTGLDGITLLALLALAKRLSGSGRGGLRRAGIRPRSGRP